MGSPGKNIKAALLLFFLYLTLHHFLCFFQLFIIFIEKNEYIIYNLFMISFEPVINKILCQLFLSICSETCSTTTSFMARWGTCLKHPQLAQFYFHGIAFKIRSFLVILQYYQFLFSAVHFIYAIYTVSCTF